jgi:hypothetical protein
VPNELQECRPPKYSSRKKKTRSFTPAPGCNPGDQDISRIRNKESFPSEIPGDLEKSKEEKPDFT